MVQLHKINKENTALYAVCGCVLIFMLCWLGSRFITLDDLTYRDIFKDFTIHTFVGRYHEWSQRFIIEYLIFYILKIDSFYLPKLITALLYVGYFFVLRAVVKKFITVDLRANLLICLLVFLQSQLELEGAGYLTTHLNYLAPLIAALWCFLLLCSEMYGIEAIAFFVLFIFATNNELVAAGAILALPYFYFKIPAKNKAVAVTAFIVAVCNLALFFNSGATTVRSCMHQIWMFPNFSDLSVLYKIYLGDVTTLLYYFANFNPFTVLFLTTLICAYFKSCSKELSVIKVSAIAVALCVLLFALGYLNRDLNDSNLKVVIANYIDFTSALRISLYLFSMLDCGLIIFMIYRLNANKSFKLNLYVLLALAFVIRLGMSFSPTLLFSQARTFVFSNAIILLCSLYIAYKFDLFRLKQFTALAIICTVVCLTSRSAFLLSDEADDFPYYPVLINQWDKIEDYCYLKYDLKDHSLLSREILEQRKTEYPFEELKNKIETRKKIISSGGEIPAPIFNIQISNGHSSLNRQLEKERKSYNEWLDEQLKSGKIILQSKVYQHDNQNFDPNAAVLPDDVQPIEQLQPLNN